jgi:hypothetical protein
MRTFEMSGKISLMHAQMKILVLLQRGVLNPELHEVRTRCWHEPAEQQSCFWSCIGVSRLGAMNP